MAARKTPSAGSKTDKPWRDALMLAVNTRDNATKAKKLRRIAEVCVASALDGDMQAIKEIADRLDGRPVQPQQIGGDPDGAPITVNILRFSDVAD